MRELTLRAERAFARTAASIDRNMAQMDEMTASLRAMNRDIDLHRLEFLEESRAQRQALLRILDRLDGNGGTAPAT
jgi:hypothetical protein